MKSNRKKTRLTVYTSLWQTYKYSQPKVVLKRKYYVEYYKQSFIHMHGCILYVTLNLNVPLMCNFRSHTAIQSLKNKPNTNGIITQRKHTGPTKKLNHKVDRTRVLLKENILQACA